MSTISNDPESPMSTTAVHARTEAIREILVLLSDTRHIYLIARDKSRTGKVQRFSAVCIDTAEGRLVDITRRLAVAVRDRRSVTYDQVRNEISLNDTPMGRFFSAVTSIFNGAGHSHELDFEWL